MSKPMDLTGQRFGRILVIERGENDKHGKTRWWCQCDCGSPKRLINGSSLKRGLTVSCGCKRKEDIIRYNQEQVIDETGHKYGKLIVIDRNTDPTKRVDGRAMWNCQCDCGNTCIVSGKLLRDGHVSSCGCGIKSRGELEIEKLLNNLNINFSTQYKVYIQQKEYEVIQLHPYYFDFAIFDNNNQLQYLIEYDGIQHFTAQGYTSAWNTQENLEKTQKRDAIKNQWCKENNIPLIRIPYTRLSTLNINDLKPETSTFIMEVTK